MNVLIVGYGSIAKKHVNALRSLSIKPKIWALRSDNLAKDINGVNSIYKYEDIPKNLDFALISNHTNKHFETIKNLVAIKIPLFIEKPAFSKLKGTSKIVSELKKNKILTYVACNLRFHPCIKFLKRKVEEESPKINEVNIYCGSYLPNWRPGRNFKESYSANKEMGGGVHLDLFHELDYTYWVFGHPNSVSSTKRKVSTLNIDAIDYANYVLEYDNFTVNIILNYFRIDSKRTIELLLNNQTIIIDLLKCNIINNNNEILFKEENFNILATYKMQMKFFLNVLKAQEKAMNTLSESIEVLKISLEDG